MPPIQSLNGLGHFARRASPIVWETASDWDSAVSESGVVHESVTNTDHEDATIVKQGYNIKNPYLSSNLIGYWPLGEDSVGTVYDFSGYNNDGSVDSATLNQTGVLGTSAYEFNGVDNKVTVPSSSSLRSPTNTNEITICAWVKPQYTEMDSRGTVCSKSGTYYLFVTSSGNISIYTFNNSGDNSSFFKSTGTIPENTWSFICGVQESDGTRRAYINGQEDSSGSFTGEIGESGVNDIGIGAEYDNRRYFDGKICYPMVFDQAVSPSKLQRLYDVVDKPGSLETATKSFDAPVTPDLTADMALNGASSFDVDVIGSPSGSAETQTVTVDTDGTATYSASWASSHSDFRVRPKPANDGDVTVTPTVNSLELVP